MELIIITILAIIVQFLVDRIKGLIPWQEIGTFKLVPLYSLAIGELIAFMVRIDLIALIGSHFGFVSNYPVIGIILTGLAISGGAEVVHELIAKLRESRITNSDGTMPQ